MSVRNFLGFQSRNKPFQMHNTGFRYREFGVRDVGPIHAKSEACLARERHGFAALSHGLTSSSSICSVIDGSIAHLWRSLSVGDRCHGVQGRLDQGVLTSQQAPQVGRPVPQNILRDHFNGKVRSQME